MSFEIKEYDPSMRADFEKQFIDYNNNDLRMQEEDPRITDKVLREKTDRLYLTAHDRDAAKFWTACGFTATGERNENGTITMEKL